MPIVKKQSNVGQTAASQHVPHGNNKPQTQSAWDLVDTIRLLLYGQSGTGKTTFWATFPGPILALICSGGSKPGELRSVNTPENRKRIHPVILPSNETWFEVLQAQMDKAQSGGFKTVVVDHLTGLADLVLMQVMGLSEPVKAKYRAAGKGESWSVVSMQQYGQLAIEMKDLLTKILNLPANVVLVAQERVFGGKEDGMPSDIIKPTVGAALTPSVTGWLNPACDYVVQTFKRPVMNRTVTKSGDEDVEIMLRGKGVEYCIRTEPHDVFMTKFRIPGGRPLPDCLVLGDSVNGIRKPSGYEQVLKLING